MVPADMSNLLLPVRQLVRPALRYSGSSNVALSRGAAVRHHADDAAANASSHTASTHRRDPAIRGSSRPPRASALGYERPPHPRLKTLRAVRLGEALVR